MEKSEQLLRNVALAIDNDRFKLILFPTEQCNFRCLYCYENYQLPKMSEKTVGAIKLFLEKRIPSLKLLELEWFGGEPLVEKDIIFDITAYAKMLCDNHNVNFYSKISTNGYLLDVDTFLRLADLGVKGYQISFDGDKEIHDQYRVLPRSTSGTFDRIWNNLLQIRNLSKIDCSVLLRCHLSSINKESIQILLSKINEAFSSDNRFSIHLRPISALGGENDDDMPYLDKESVSDVMMELMDSNKELTFLDIDEDNYVCYASQPNSFLIRSDGTIGKCTVGLDCKENSVGKLQSDGTIKMDAPKFFLWCSGIDNLDNELLACPYYALKRKGTIK